MPELSFIPELPTKPGDKRVWGQAIGSALSLAIATAAQKNDGLTLVVTPDSLAADRIERETRFFLGENSQIPVLNFPDWETLPYDTFSPHQDIISQRLHTLYQLPKVTQGVLIVPVTTLMHRITPKDYLLGNTLLLDVGQKFVLETFRHQLESAGYRCVDTVYEHGEFTVRGSILDLFPMGSDIPFRIDLFDDEIDTLRTFDPETQRSIEKVEEIRLLPAKEFPLTDQAITKFRQMWRETFDVDVRKCPIYQDVSEGISPPGIEYYLSLFFDHCETLFDYLPDNTLIFTPGPIDSAIEHFWSEANARYESRRVDPEKPILPPHRVFVPSDELFGNLKRFPRITLSKETLGKKAGKEDLNTETPPTLPIDARLDNPVNRIEQYLKDYSGRVLFCAESAGRRETLLDTLSSTNLRLTNFDGWNDFLTSKDPIGITVVPLEQGLVLTEPSVSLISESQLFGERVMQRRRRKKEIDNADQVIKNLTELRVGAPVVHIDNGIGRYLGLQTISVDSQEAEFLTLEYADSAKLYVPVSSLHLISRYTGADDDSAPLHKLGSEQWTKAKKKAAEQARDAAAELLDIYARRAAKKGFRFDDPKENYTAFAAGFPFEETPDQESAINTVVKDMMSDKAMDRLVCGDVGFGKTEVAMRAAFMAVSSDKQVAILVPTTLLAQQHYESFRDRFADWPVKIEVLSRFKSTKEINQTFEHIKSGTADIIIGTHKLIQDNLTFKRLGLLIIDEEHRFGVRQKEKLKSLRSEVDILTMTATPIPRTLNMAMSGMRDLSIISTPPARRLSVKTFVRQRDDNLIKEALLREILRGGQVYVLHNDVKTIEKAARDIEALAPEARVGIAHGQLRERELEQVMSDFYHKRFNILICSTIIETGIDIPNANTIIIERADKFGLAQLHQLRGRVGRSHHQAYAYLMTPNKKSMTTDAIKRLDAIEAAHDLGAGFTLATHDLEIRGAGELLGDVQSGQIQTVGFTLYMEILERAVESIKNGETPNLDQPLAHGAEINLRLPALIPEDYLPDVHARLIMYKRISNAKNAGQLRDLQVEMIDRFGLLPNQLKYLFRITELKLSANQLGISKIDAGDKGGKLEFSSNTNIEPITIVKMVQTMPQKYKMEGATQLRFHLDMNDHEARLQKVGELLQELSPSTPTKKSA